MEILPAAPAEISSSRRRRRFAACLSLLLFAAACLPPPANAEDVKPSDAPTEQRWIIGAIARDLVGMTAAAADPAHWSAPPADAVEVRESAGVETGLGYSLAVRLAGGGEPMRNDLKITGSVWSPELYVPTLQALFAKLKITPPAAGKDADGTPPDADLLKALARPLTTEIEARNKQISASLQDHPLDARAHEQAALLLGTLAMRENSGFFWDPRGLCNRAAAHLALARALRPGPPSVCGEVAELLIGLMIDTKADCQKRIAALQARVAANPELGPWASAAALRNTRDYRLLADPKKATLLERLELFRALTEAVSVDQAISRTKNYDPSSTPDWARMVVQSSYGVNAGHAFAGPSAGLELKDAATVFPELAKARTAEQFAAIFNPPPGEAVQAGDDGRAQWHVIDRGTWARFFQRHLLQAADETYDFLRNKWGVEDEAKQFHDQVAPLLTPLTLYPLCLEHLGGSAKERAELVPRAADLLNNHPEWVSDNAWWLVAKYAPPRSATGGSWPVRSQAWFSPRLPTGTVYGFGWRTTWLKGMPAPTLAEWTKYHDIAPFKYNVCLDFLTASAPKGHPTVEQFKAMMGDLPSYYLPAIRAEADIVKDDPARYGLLLEQAGTLEPSYYLTLGRYYREHHMEPEAAKAFQAAIDHEADPVALSNSCKWLVNYYFDHGQQERAMTIAKQMAEVYSSGGLETLAGLYEKMNRNPDAESYYQKIQERYGNAGPLNAFYARASSKDPAYAQKLKAAGAKVFPQGMETVELSQLSGKPADGVLVHGENERTHQCGLKANAIIVGIDGKRVHKLEQYYYVRALTDTPEIELVVYQDERYQAIHASLPGRQFGLDFTSWVAEH